MPIASLLLVIIGAILASNSEKTWWGVILLAIGMVGSFLSIVKYRRGS